MKYKVGDKVRVINAYLEKWGYVYVVGEIGCAGVFSINHEHYFLFEDVEPAYEEGELVDLNLNDGDVVQWTGKGVRSRKWAYPYVGEIRLVGKYGSGSVAGVQKHCLHEYTGIWRVFSRAEVKEEIKMNKYTTTETKLVAGTYGVVRVWPNGKVYIGDIDCPKELREAAATLVAMADELEGKK